MKFSVVLFHHGRAASLAISPGSSPVKVELDVRALFAEPRSLGRGGKGLNPVRTVRGAPGARVSLSADGKKRIEEEEEEKKEKKNNNKVGTSDLGVLRATSTPLVGFYDSIARKLVRLEDASSDPASHLTSKFGYYPVFAEAEKAFQVAARVSYDARLNKPLYSILLKDRWPQAVLKVPARPRFRERFNFGRERELVGAMNRLGFELAVRTALQGGSGGSDSTFVSPLALCGCVCLPLVSGLRGRNSTSARQTDPSSPSSSRAKGSLEARHRK